MAQYYEGMKYRLVTVATTGTNDSIDVTDIDSAEAQTFIAEKNAAGISVQAFRSYWKETILPFSFFPAQD